jgi:hypothetical protein
VTAPPAAAQAIVPKPTVKNSQAPKAVQTHRPVRTVLPQHPHRLVRLHGHDHNDTAQRRTSAPWYRTKSEPSTLDMLIKIRRQIIATRFLPPHPDQQQPKKSWKSSKPGHKQPPNRKNREITIRSK